MKYKLINKTTGIETFCYKVTIDGFDYYVTEYNVKKEGQYCVSSDCVIFKDENHFPISIGQRMIIATNNPNIDIPKVVDEVEKLASEFAFCYPGSQSEEEYDSKLMGYYHGYNKSQETHSFSEEDMIEFLNYYQKTCLLAFNSSGQNHGKTTKELLQLWKEQQPKIVYYE